MSETRRLLCALLALALGLAATGGRADSARPSLELRRDVTRLFVRAGASTTIVYRVENTGGEPLESVRVTDALCGAVSGPETLAPGEYRVYTVTAAITGACRSAPTASWLFEGMRYEKTLEPVAIALADDRLSLALSADVSEVPAGGVVSLRATLRNEGNTALREIALEDEARGPVGVVPGPLGPGGEAVFSYDAQLTGSAAFRLSAAARSESGETVSAVSNGVTVLLSPGEGAGRLSLRAAAEHGALRAPGPVRVEITLVNSGGSDLGGVTVSELRAGELRSLAALGPGETGFVCECPVPETGEMQFLAEYGDKDGGTAIVFSAPVRVDIRPGGAEPAAGGGDPLENLGGPSRLSERRSAYGVFVWGMLSALGLLAAVLLIRVAGRHHLRRLRRERRIRRMRMLRRSARMDEAEWVRTRPHRPVSPDPQQKE